MWIFRGIKREFCQRNFLRTFRDTKSEFLKRYFKDLKSHNKLIFLEYFSRTTEGRGFCRKISQGHLEKNVKIYLKDLQRHKKRIFWESFWRTFRVTRCRFSVNIFQGRSEPLQVNLLQHFFDILIAAKREFFKKIS